jgi:hypothetical protein
VYLRTGSTMDRDPGVATWYLIQITRQGAAAAAAAGLGHCGSAASCTPCAMCDTAVVSWLHLHWPAGALTCRPAGTPAPPGPGWPQSRQWAVSSSHSLRRGPQRGMLRAMAAPVAAMLPPARAAAGNALPCSGTCGQGMELLGFGACACMPGCDSAAGAEQRVSSTVLLWSEPPAA